MIFGYFSIGHWKSTLRKWEILQSCSKIRKFENHWIWVFIWFPLNRLYHHQFNSENRRYQWKTYKLQLYTCKNYEYTVVGLASVLASFIDFSWGNYSTSPHWKLLFMIPNNFIIWKLDQIVPNYSFYSNVRYKKVSAMVIMLLMWSVYNSLSQSGKFKRLPLQLKECCLVYLVD